MTMSQQKLADVFLELTGGRDTPSDVSSLLSALAHHTPGLTGAAAAGVLFGSRKKEPVRVAGSDQEVHRLVLDSVGWGEGPGHDCHRTGTAGHGVTLDGDVARQRWPRYASRARALGYTSVTTVPLRGGEQTVGALVLLTTEERPLPDGSPSLAQSLADFSAITLLRWEEIQRSRALTTQLEHALTSRVLIEQAKGLLAARRRLSMDDAFALLRGYARSRQRSLHEVAGDVVEGRLDLGGAEH